MFETWMRRWNDMCLFIRISNGLGTNPFHSSFQCFVVIIGLLAGRWLCKPYLPKNRLTVSRATCVVLPTLKLLLIFLSDMALFFRHVRQITRMERFDNFVGRPLSFLSLYKPSVLYFFYNFLYATLWQIYSTSTLHNVLYGTCVMTFFLQFNDNNPAFHINVSCIHFI